MKLKRNRFSTLNISILFLTILFCFTACSFKAEQNSLTSQFDLIDALIAQNQIKEADKELKKIQKNVYDSWSYIGIYKRYKLLGEGEKGEKLLKAALKKNSENQELNAVYADYLLRNDRLDEAVKVTEKLKGGVYGSLHSEANLRKAALQNKFENSEAKISFYKGQQFYDIYFDAYTGTKNPLWLRNCAAFNLTRGQFGAAASLNQGIYSDADDAYFWALVLYDAGRFYDSINAIEESRQFLLDFPNSRFYKVSDIKLIALESDAYMAISDVDNAEKIRKNLIVNLDTLNISKADEELVPIIVTNSAIWALNQQLNDTGADLLFYVVSNWPDYVPALLHYADFAYESNLEREEDMEMKALRRAGLSTLEMDKYDNRRKVPLSDALYRIDTSLKRQSNPYLEIKKLDIRYKTQSNLSEKERNRDLWNLIENNYEIDTNYRNLLIQYGERFLLTTKQMEDAWNLYYKYVTENMMISEKRPFWEQFIEQMKQIDLPMVEFGAWFAANDKLYDEAFRIYEYCVYESSGILDDGVVSPYVGNGACMNLADMYFASGKKDKALELYGKAAGRESNSLRRSEIYYRIACVYNNYGDTRDALRSSEYAKEIYPENAKAGLLIDKLKK